MENHEYQRELGERLRAIRQQQGVTLQEIETRTGGAWKAVVIGSYERGDRAVSIARLADLARVYGVPVAELLPRPPAPTRAEDAMADAAPRVVLDLTRLSTAAAAEPDLDLVSRYARRIQAERGDYNGRILTLRDDDVRALSAVFDEQPHELVHQLRDRDILVA